MIATTVLVLRLALAVALYAFLGWALWTLLQELKQQGDKLALQKTPEITLFIQMDQGEETRYHFSQPQIMIGRDPKCDLAMMDEALSAHHARLAYITDNGGWKIQPTNELRTNEINHLAVVIAGDQVKCGNTPGIQLEDAIFFSPPIPRFEIEDGQNVSLAIIGGSAIRNAGTPGHGETASTPFAAERFARGTEGERGVWRRHGIVHHITPSEVPYRQISTP
jgi:hypothetical protein